VVVFARIAIHWLGTFKMKKVVINDQFGGFGLSDEAYEWLIAHGIRVDKYHKEPRNPETGLYDIKPPENEGEVIFDRSLTPENEKEEIDRLMESNNYSVMGKYWETWIDARRDWPLLIQCVEELGSEHASGKHATLKIVEIPDDVDYEIEEYDGNEYIAEKHRTWS